MSEIRPDQCDVRQGNLRQRADALIQACLRNEHPPWPEPGNVALAEAVLERCDFHGTSALLYQRLGQTNGWPRKTLEGLRDRCAAAAIWEEHHRRYLSALLPELVSRGIEPILLKGTALAYTCYDDAALRIRSDTDLLIPPTVRDQAGRMLCKLGFERGAQIHGEFVSYQACHMAVDQLGSAHAVDLHWRINNGQVLAELFSHAELRARAVPAPRLCPGAWATSRPDAILIACMHREVHACIPYQVRGVAHYSADRLIWFYDLHILAETLTADELRVLVRLAHEKGLVGICHDGLKRTAEVLGTNLPAELLRALDFGDRRETPRIYLNAGPIRRELLNLGATTGLRRKLRFLQEHLLPPSSYMRERFAEVRPSWIPWLYVRRVVMGTAKWIRRRRDGRAGGSGA